MGDGDPRGGELLLRGPRELQHVAEGGDGERPADARGAEGRGHARGDAADVDAVGDVAVLEVPPHRHRHRPGLLVLLRREERGPPPLAAVAVDRGAEAAAAAVAADAVGVGVRRREAAEEDLGHGGGKGSAAAAAPIYAGGCDLLLQGFGKTLSGFPLLPRRYEMEAPGCCSWNRREQEREKETNQPPP